MSDRDDWPKELVTGNLKDRGLRHAILFEAPLRDDWRSWKHPIPDKVLRQQLLYEITRATLEYHELEQRIRRENREQRDHDSS